MTSDARQPDPDRAAELEEAVAGFVQRWLDGEPPDLEAACAARPELLPQLREELEDFLFISDGLTGSDDGDRTCSGSRVTSVDLTGTVIGPYELVRVLGEGGMGLVYLAVQREPIRREVALKVIKTGADSSAVLARFQVERQALARMEHDNIAKILDAGAMEDGRPFFVMEYVRGDPLVAHCETTGTDLRQRLELFLKVCEGVQHAHRKGVMHRDLKPGNILVTRQGDRTVPKIIDFGLARATDYGLAGGALQTNQGLMVGTPEYMSPEQAGFDHVEVDSRTDVYSLGVVLYELLTGVLPFPPEELRRKGLAEIQRTIREVDPPTPSQRILTRATVPSGLASAIRGDLDWITMRAMEKDPDRRYGTVEALARDVECHLADEPVAAGPPTVGYRLGKLFRRNRAAVFAGTAIAIAVLVGLVAALWQGQRAATALESYRNMRDVPLCQDLLAETQRDLWPAHPRNVARIEDWLARARALAGRAPVHRKLHRSLGAAGEPRDYETRFQESVLGGLVRGLDELEQKRIPRAAEMLRQAKSLEERSLRQASWAEAVRAIAMADGIVASDGYRDMPRLVPQLGLVPLGADPDSKLWEFAVLDSGEMPRRDAAGVLRIDEKSAIVLVLLPPDRFQMGAPDSDEQAQADERPEHSIALDAFFLAKHELTQGQWLRVMDANPSTYYAPRHGPDRRPITMRHPVENVSFEMAELVMHRLGLTLPTEAQWEYAARAGSQKRWWPGDDRTSLLGVANLADRAFRAMGIHRGHQDFDDGYAIHSPVGALRPNAFGLHDVHGNVWEWCRDCPGTYDSPGAPGDGLRTGPRPEIRACRGGSYYLEAKDARSSNRGRDQLHAADSDMGLRPARAVER